EYSGLRLEESVRAHFPLMARGVLEKAFRKRDIRVNGIREGKDHILASGDTVSVYVVDELLDNKPSQRHDTADNGATGDNRAAGDNKFTGVKPYEIVYEDNNIIIVYKRQGLPVHPDPKTPRQDATLIGMLRKHAGEEVELCHRLDRNTGGLIIAAKNRESLDIITERFRNNEIKKYYQCLVKGVLPDKSGLLRAWLYKDSKQSKVYIHNDKKPGRQEILTGYRLIEYKDGISRLEIELITGRTHQIRAHLAFTGHPVLGDGKYGTNAVNKPSGYNMQALAAYKIVFDFKTPAGKLNYLRNRTFKIEPHFEKCRQ
ncbi:MAG: RluA family pseudouridine synthase, partial [Eubacteriales bacterium]|nr:RluA family pseudouridine synthase [Eubacteriales bacterium]